MMPTIHIFSTKKSARFSALVPLIPSSTYNPQNSQSTLLSIYWMVAASFEGKRLEAKRGIC
jgi:hypothetical protein